MSADPSPRPVISALLSSGFRTIADILRRFLRSRSRRPPCPDGQGGAAAERARIARELHDRIGQNLGVAYRSIELHEIAGAGAALDEHLMTAQEALREALGEVRAVIAGLQPGLDLDPDDAPGGPVATGGRTGLETALRRYLDSMAHRRIDTALTVSGDEASVPPDVLDETLLVVREALHNAIRHARASRVSADVRLAPDAVVATVVDDGTGFDGQLAVGGTGLASMRERARKAGGSLSVRSTATGTRVELIVPTPPRSPEPR